MKYKPYIIFTSLITLALLVIFIISSGYYPILSVNGHLVSAKTFWKNYQAGAAYYQSVKRAFSGNLDGEEITPNDLKRSILTQLIENKLIEGKVREEVGTEMSSLVKEKITKLTSDPKIKQAAQAIYNLSLGDFEKEILLPMANQEILVGRLFLKGEKVETWLSETKKSSQIRVFSSQFYWDGEEVQVKKK